MNKYFSILERALLVYDVIALKDQSAKSIAIVFSAAIAESIVKSLIKKLIDMKRKK